MTSVREPGNALQPLLNAEGVASILHVPVRSVYVLVENRQLGHYKLGRRLRFQAQDIERFLEQGRVPEEPFA